MADTAAQERGLAHVPSLHTARAKQPLNSTILPIRSNALHGSNLGVARTNSFHQRLSFLFCDYCGEVRIVSHFIVSVGNDGQIQSERIGELLKRRFGQAGSRLAPSMRS